MCSGDSREETYGRLMALGGVTRTKVTCATVGGKNRVAAHRAMSKNFWKLIISNPSFLGHGRHVSLLT